MAIEMNMPQLGYDMSHGTLIRWLKEEGSLVKKGEPVVEIETDKAVVEVEAEEEGVLRKILVLEGVSVPVGSPIAIIGEKDEDISDFDILNVADSLENSSEEEAVDPINVIDDSKTDSILAVKEAKNNLLINLDIIKNITQAESLRGKLIKVYVKDTYPLDSGSYYYFQLLDLNVFTENFQYLGDVKDIINTGANDVYVVSSEHSKEILLPAISEVVLKIDLNKKQMIVKIPKGLL